MFNYFLKVSPTADPVASPGSPSQHLTSPANTTEQGCFFFFFLIKIEAWDFSSHLLLAFLSAVRALLAGEQQIRNRELPKQVQIWGQPEVTRRVSTCSTVLQFVSQPSPVGKSCSFQMQVAIARQLLSPPRPCFSTMQRCLAPNWGSWKSPHHTHTHTHWQSFAKLLIRTRSQQLLSPGVVRVARGGSEGFVPPAYFLVLPPQPGST